MTIILISYLVYIFGVLVLKKKVQVLKLKKMTLAIGERHCGSASCLLILGHRRHTTV